MRERALGRLAPQLCLQRALGSRALGLDRLALEVHARLVAIEGFLERGDDDAGELGIEGLERPRRRRCRDFASGLRAPGPRRREARDGIEHSHPLRYAHGASLLQETRARCYVPTCDVLTGGRAMCERADVLLC